ncbi:DUF4367 domain-containing protein [Paenibacillus sp. 22594]|uniref:DUF4367 domain-containing protein n=1 Tax=Paenibacillus sp. 22594 TaxID=3453947 RepID=UPI003F83C1F2
MGKGELTLEEQFLKEGDHSANFPPVDVHDAVIEAIGLSKVRLAADPLTRLHDGDTPLIMQRTETLTGAKHRRKKILRIPVRSWAVALILIVLLGGGYSLYTIGPGQAAKFHYEVLPYEPLLATEEGGTIDLLKTPLTPGPQMPQRQVSKEEELLNIKYAEGFKAVEKLLLPGEFASFVLRQEGGGEQYRTGVISPTMIFTDYSSYLTKAEKYTAPSLKQPDYMPEGYAFEEAWIQPVFKNIEEKELLALTGGIKLEGGFRVTWRQEPLKNVNFDYATLVYKKGESQVRINARHIKGKTGTVETLMWTKTTRVENIDINGKQLIYLEPAKNDDFKTGYKYRLVWSDPEQEMIYDLTANPENTVLTKDEAVRIAGAMMN